MGCKFDSKSPLIAVPVSASSLDAVEEEVAQAVAAGANLVEWRLDYLDIDPTDELVHQLGAGLRKTHGLPVLVTVRTEDEGGHYRGSNASYRKAIRLAAKWADLVDVEAGQPGAEELIAEISDTTCVVASFHDFTASPSAGITQKLLAHMQDMGAGVGKVAWMVRNADDLALIQRLQEWAVKNLQMPTVVIGMGDLGQPSRLGASARRSAFTFARGVQVSAPGQPTVTEIRDSLEQN